MPVYFLKNGYKGTTRNIVDDAKFETRVNEENKRTWVQLVRQQTEGAFSPLLSIRFKMQYYLQIFISY